MMGQETLFNETQNRVFNTLFTLDVNEHVEKKKAGNTQLAYLSWAWAWSEVKKAYPSAECEIEKFEDDLPYVFDKNTGYMVFTKVTIEGLTYEMWLPVMDGTNKAMKAEPYTYKVIKWTNGKRDGFTDKSVEAATMFDINKTIMRCLVKNLAMFGLGLYIYAGEDLPESPIATAEQKKEIEQMIEEMAGMLKKSPKTVKAQLLARLRYAGKFDEIDQNIYEALKDMVADGLHQMKVAAENKKEKADE